MPVPRNLAISLGLLALGLSAPVTAHSVSIDGDASDWVGTPSAVSHEVVVDAEEWIYTGDLGDQRTDPADIVEPNYDLTEVRVTRDATNIYFLVRFRDVTDTDEPYVAVGFDLDQSPSDPNGLNFLGDDSGLDPPLFGPASPEFAPDVQLVVHNATAGVTVVEMFSDIGGGWASPGSEESFISATNDLMEFSVPLASIGLTTTSTFGLILATFDNSVGFANVIDTTVDYDAGGNIDALDIMTNTPGSALNSFDRELGDLTFGPDAVITVDVTSLPVEMSLLGAD